MIFKDIKCCKSLTQFYVQVYQLYLDCPASNIDFTELLSCLSKYLISVKGPCCQGLVDAMLCSVKIYISQNSNDPSYLYQTLNCILKQVGINPPTATLTVFISFPGGGITTVDLYIDGVLVASGLPDGSSYGPVQIPLGGVTVLQSINGSGYTTTNSLIINGGPPSVIAGSTRLVSLSCNDSAELTFINN